MAKARVTRARRPSDSRRRRRRGGRGPARCPARSPSCRAERCSAGGALTRARAAPEQRDLHAGAAPVHRPSPDAPGGAPGGVGAPPRQREQRGSSREHVTRTRPNCAVSVTLTALGGRCAAYRVGRRCTGCCSSRTTTRSAWPCAWPSRTRATRSTRPATAAPAWPPSTATNPTSCCSTSACPTSRASRCAAPSGPRASCRSSSSPPRPTPTTWWPGSRPAPTTTSPSRSCRRSWRPASGRCCGGCSCTSPTAAGHRRSATSSCGGSRASCLKRGEELPLTKTEFRLLCEFADHAGMVLSRDQLLERVWGYDYLGDSRLVDAHIRRLRVKIEDHADDPRLIVTVRGIGYRAAGRRSVAALTRLRLDSEPPPGGSRRQGSPQEGLGFGAVAGAPHRRQGPHHVPAVAGLGQAGIEHGDHAAVGRGADQPPGRLGQQRGGAGQVDLAEGGGAGRSRRASNSGSSGGGTGSGRW